MHNAQYCIVTGTYEIACTIMYVIINLFKGFKVIFNALQSVFTPLWAQKCKVKNKRSQNEKVTAQLGC